MLIQKWIPHHLLSNSLGLLANCKVPWLKNFLIRQFISQYQVNLQEAKLKTIEEYLNFNEFFTRQLDLTLRPLSPHPNRLLSPIDGTLIEFGHIADKKALAVKGKFLDFSALLDDASLARQFEQGIYANFYLAPHNYHRIHMPLSGELSALYHIPGRLFSVKPACVRKIPTLFSQNERVVCVFNTHHGKIALVLVGALFVGSIQTRWSEHMTSTFHSFSSPIPAEQLEEMGLFQFGSTVVLLMEKFSAHWENKLHPGCLVRMGDSLATFSE